MLKNTNAVSRTTGRARTASAADGRKCDSVMRTAHTSTEPTPQPVRISSTATTSRLRAVTAGPRVRCIRQVARTAAAMIPAAPRARLPGMRDTSQPTTAASGRAATTIPRPPIRRLSAGPRAGFRGCRRSERSVPHSSELSRKPPVREPPATRAVATGPVSSAPTAGRAAETSFQPRRWPKSGVPPGGAARGSCRLTLTPLGAPRAGGRRVRRRSFRRRVPPSMPGMTGTSGTRRC